ncbi:hypothetical protein [Couchioplanes caeruleus]|uniref:Uncharacterized protein n=1 Tax=Couchioplanes caeruleus TaxID=56438 RepID=A0A3N1GJM6_9ACTN|nr:hypothetical protein [Couchioplanes caeruleus]ROP30472.1 hypothetical protein EDD30_3325 [Couchioplanes caeruleus]
MSSRFSASLVAALVAACLAVGLGVLVHAQPAGTAPPATAVVAPTTPPSDPNGSCVSCT